MKLAVSTDDKKTIRKGDFERARYFLIYEILNGVIFSEEIKENPYAQQKEKGNGEKLTEFLSECQLFMGNNFDNQSLPLIAEKNIDAIISSIENIKEAVSSYLNSKDEYFKYYDAQTGRFCDCWSR